MITDALLNFALSAFQFFWDLVPDWQITLPENFWHITAQFMRWDLIAPISEARNIIAVTATAFGAVLGLKVVIKLVDWVMDIIP